MGGSLFEVPGDPSGSPGGQFVDARARDVELARLKEAVGERDRRIAALRQAVAERDRQLRQLRHATA